MNSTVTALDLQRNQIGHAGASELGKALVVGVCWLPFFVVVIPPSGDSPFLPYVPVGEQHADSAGLVLQ